MATAIGTSPRRATSVRGRTNTVHAASVADKSLDGVFDGAPSVLPDADGNGICDERDSKAFGLASKLRKARFFINP
jgi:hypothetical protein